MEALYMMSLGSLAVVFYVFGSVPQGTNDVLTLLVFIGLVVWGVVAISTLLRFATGIFYKMRTSQNNANQSFTEESDV